MKITADDPLQRALDHPGKTLIGIKYGIVPGNEQRPFVHGFDEHSVSFLGSVQGEQLQAFFGSNQNDVHFTEAYGAERFLRLSQTSIEFVDFAGRVGMSWTNIFQSASMIFLTRSSSAMRPVMLVRLPMNLRSGGG